MTDTTNNANEATQESKDNVISESYQITISDITCQHCVSRVEKIIHSMEGVKDGSVNLIEKSAQVSGGNPESVVQAIIDQGYDAKLVIQELPSNTYVISINSSTLNPAIKVSDFLEQSDGISEIQELDTPTDGSIIKLAITTTSHPAYILLLLQEQGIQARLLEQNTESYEQKSLESQAEINASWQKAILAGIVGITLMISMKAGWLPKLQHDNGQWFWLLVSVICLFTMWFSGRHYYSTAIKQARYKSANMDTLIALGTGAAWLSSIIIVLKPDFIPGGGHLYFDAAVFILAFLNMGHALELKAKKTTVKAITSLIELAPKKTNILQKYKGDVIELEIPVSLLRIGDHIKIRPGGRLPIDGIILEGSTNIDESMLTGEALAVKKNPGDRVTGGSINQSGSFTFEVDRLASDTTLAHIIDMVRTAQVSKPQIGRLVDKIAGIFVPIVISIAVITFISWYFLGPQPNMAYALTTGIAVLVIACPCALGLATPIAIMMGTGKAAQYNILIKNSDALQTASTLTHLVVDKTGTLTQGKPVLTQLTAYHTDESTVLQLAASLEQYSEHPLAKTILDAAEHRGIELVVIDDFQAVQGRGVKGSYKEQTLILGNRLFLQEHQIDISDKNESDTTTIWLAMLHPSQEENQLVGQLILEDPIRSDSLTAITQLKKQNIEVVMCTGDSSNAASSVAHALGISQIHSELLPEDKLNVIEQLQSQGHIVGMVGDGINDAPALAKANTGFAIGSGTDVAIENADITLAGNSLTNVCTAIAISSATIKNIKQNLFGAFIYNIIGIPLAAGFFYPITGWLLAPAFASAAMAMSSVTVVVNANRLRFFKSN